MPQCSRLSLAVDLWKKPNVFPEDHSQYINKQTKKKKVKNILLPDCIVFIFLNVAWMPWAAIRTFPQAVSKTASNVTSHTSFFSHIFFILSLPTMSFWVFFCEFPWRLFLLNRLEVTSHCAGKQAPKMGETLRVLVPKPQRLFSSSCSRTPSL